MNRIKAWLRNFFGFSRRETNAFLILLPLMFILIFSEPVYRFWFVRQPREYSEESKKLDSLITTFRWENDSVKNDSLTTALNLFLFDPNKASLEELMGLGFSKPLANRIGNYRLKQGKFLVKNDLMKIYGMDSTLFRKLYTYIDLPESITKKKSIDKQIQKFESKEKILPPKFDLNKADTAELIKIYGIGSKLAQRIVLYREKLGGFISDLQLNEIYGLDSTVVKRVILKSFIEENFQPKQININTATEKELGSHPYIKYKIAKAIVAYRAQHGKFNSVDDLKKIVFDR